jgi:type IV secretion system protein VirB10
MSDTNTGALPTLDEASVPVGEKRSKTNVGRFTVLAMVVGILLFILVVVLLWVKSRQPTEDATRMAAALRPKYEEKNTEVQNDNIDSQKAKILKEEREKAEQERQRRRAEEEAARRAREAEEALRQAGVPASRPGTPVKKEETPDERAMRSPVLLPLTGTPVVAAQGKSQGQGSPAPGVSEEEQRQREVDARMRALDISPRTAGSGATLASSDGDSLGGRLRTTNLPATTAGRLLNLDYLLKRGTVIPCILKTGINTQLPGFVLCTALSDVYSANAKTLLIERGATLFGEQQSQLKKGQARTFVIWSRVDNPSGITANIDSPGTDMMGYSGLPGIVDYHFIERFGAAILLTVVKDFSQAVADRYSERSGNTISLGGDSDDTSSMAQEALRDSIGIPPNLVVKPGTVVHVLVARDVTFEGVYTVVR